MANDFPDKVDCIILGTGSSECVISSGLSVNGVSILHLDKLQHYGQYEGSVKISDLEELIDEWKLSENKPVELNSSDGILPILTNFVDVLHSSIYWDVNNIEISQENNSGPASNSECERTLDNESTEIDQSKFQWTEQKIRSLSRRIDFDLMPKLFYATSEPVDAIIQSDVTRYLEFKFVTRLLTLSSDAQIKQIPVSRGDVFKSKLYSLKQKRQLCSFLEWCFSVNEDDSELAEYADVPLREFLSNKKSLDNDLQDMIIYSLAFQPSHVNTKMAVKSLKQLLSSMNKFGPYPIMRASYGAGEIPQAYARLSAVFGGIFCLNRSIESIKQNEESEDAYVVKLTTGESLTTNQIIINRSYISSHNSNKRFIGRAILLTDKSILPLEDGKPNTELTLLAYPLDEASNLAFLMEIPVDCSNTDCPPLFIVHLTCALGTDIPAENYFKPILENLFTSSDSSCQSLEKKPAILLRVYFNLPDYSCTSMEDQSQSHIPHIKNIHLISGLHAGIGMDHSLSEARRVFNDAYPDLTFLPRPPNPEDIIHYSDQSESNEPTSNEVAGLNKDEESVEVENANPDCGDVNEKDS